MASLSKVGVSFIPSCFEGSQLPPSPHTSSEILGWESCLFLYLAKTSTALLSRGTSWNLQVSEISPRQLPTCHRCTWQKQWEEESHGLVWTWMLGLHPKCPTLVHASIRKKLLLVMGRGGAGEVQFIRHFESAIISRTVDRKLLDY